MRHVKLRPGGRPDGESLGDLIAAAYQDMRQRLDIPLWRQGVQRAMTQHGDRPLEASASASDLIDARIAELGDWRGATLARVRALIRQAEPDVVETWKWRGVPVWEHAGIICTGETYKAVVKLTFARGAALEDPSGLFNSSLEGNVRRAIDFREGDAIEEEALKALVRAAAALNLSARIARKNRKAPG